MTMFENPGAVNEALSIQAGSTTTGDGPFIYKSKYTADGKPSDEGLSKLIADEMEFCKRELQEGSVLLENNGALPLKENERRVSLFGRASTDVVYRGGSGGPRPDPTREINWKKAMTDAGFTINQALYDAYAAAPYKRVLSSDTSADIAECPASFYTDAVKSTFSSDYKDAAIVILSRYTGEGADASTKDKDGISLLALHDSERAMLDVVKNGGFGKIIVILNSVHPMEIGELADYGVDSVLWIGNPGYYGLAGVASILKGEASPSGHLVDAFAADSLSSPAMMNWGDYTYEGSDSAKYVVNLEGIYTGYKYYETRYEDAVLGQGNATSPVGVYTSSGNWNYADEMLYTFGYGLSYTTFTQELVKNGDLPYTYDEASKEFTFQVKVTNTGDFPAKSVVQVYAQQPYTEYDKANLVEKSAIQIVGYTKTQELKAGESETVTVKVPLYFLASYDSKGAKGYILDAGNYYFAIGDDAHDALNNILAQKAAEGMTVNKDLMTDAKGNKVEGDAAKVAVYDKITEPDTETFKNSPYEEDVQVTNQFDDVDVNFFYGDTEYKQTYLTRQSWDTTYPKTVVLPMIDAVKNAMDMETYDGKSSTTIKDVTTGVNKGITLADMVGVDINTEEGYAKWLEFIQQLTISELAKGTGDQFGTRSVKSVGKPTANFSEGPEGVSVKYLYGNKGQATGYASTPVLAATWNTDMMRERGEFEAEDAIYCGVIGFFSPGNNLHRSPFLGRYADYWSEDGLFSYLSVQHVTKALSEKGMISMMKHFVANNMETNRQGVCTFTTEQQLRQESLRAFEGPFTVGESLGTMSSYNRIGTTQTQCSKALLTTVLREEWGFKGIAITDAIGEGPMSPTIENILSGTTLFCQNFREVKIQNTIEKNDDGDLLLALQKANMYNMYAYANSQLVNGLTADSSVVDVTPWWQPAIIAVDIAFGVLLLACVVMYVLKRYVLKGKGRGGV